jgi:hypothetical protein
VKYESQYYGVVQMEDIIEHHGIKGMKWGVRNGPPYPIGSKTRKAMAKARTNKGKITYGSKNNRDPSDHSRRGIKTVALEVGLGAFTAYNLGSLASKLITGYDIVMKTPVGLLNVDGMAAAAIIGTGIIAKHVLGTAVSHIKEKKANERISKLEIDKKTGLPKKDREWSKEEDMKAVNPSFKNFSDNSKNNCMLCTTAFDLRQRGYDVRAGNAAYGYKNADLKSWYPNAEIKRSNPFKISSDLKSQGDGARGNLMVHWTGSFSGHSLAYEVNNGKVTVYDAQSGKKQNMALLMSKVSGVEYARLDNVEPDWKKVKGLVR